MNIKVSGLRFYPEEFRRKIDAEKYQAKGTCEMHLALDNVKLDLKNVTYRIDHEGKTVLKPPFRIHSNKKAGIKPKLVPSVVFRETEIWGQIEKAIKEELSKGVKGFSKSSKACLQLDFLEDLI